MFARVLIGERCTAVKLPSLSSSASLYVASKNEDDLLRPPRNDKLEDLEARGSGLLSL